VSGELKQWHKVTLTVEGPATSEDATPNPFLDLRMDVTFAHAASSSTYRVPGYFAADGDAANSSATSGNRWRAHLAPSQVGQWTYRVSFRQGSNVAVADSSTAGTALAPFDGMTGQFTVGPSDKTGRDFRSKGMLNYVNRHHLQFAGSREFFLKVGSDSPENFFAYDDFDNTPNYTWQNAAGQTTGGFRRDYAAHVQDWRSGDPTFKGDRGKGIIGSLNYLASKGMNWQSWMPYTTHGDDRNVSMYVDDEDRTRIDVSKVEQWEVVLDYMDRIGIGQEVKIYEAEGASDHDRGEMGPERRLFFREMIARFGHHLALVWNTGEENTQTRAQRIDMAEYLYDNDPYHHLVVIHNGSVERLFFPLLGKQSRYTGASLQLSYYDNFDVIRMLRIMSAQAGVPWVLTLDETRPNAAVRAATTLTDATAPDELDPEHNEPRKGGLWASLMAGGAGTQTYFGYSFEQGGDLRFTSFRPWSGWWDQMRHAHEFFVNNAIPFQDMSSQVHLVSSGWALAGANHVVAYFPNGLCTAGRGGGGGMGGAAFAPAPPAAPAGGGAGTPAPATAAQPADLDSPCPAAPGVGRGAGAGASPPPSRHGGPPPPRPPQPAGITVDLSGMPAGTYELRWYDPRQGGALQTGTVAVLNGAARNAQSVGMPPSRPRRDWVLLIRAATP
jgi:hypothetical protein